MQEISENCKIDIFNPSRFNAIYIKVCEGIFKWYFQNRLRIKMKITSDAQKGRFYSLKIRSYWVFTAYQIR